MDPHYFYIFFWGGRVLRTTFTYRTVRSLHFDIDVEEQIPAIYDGRIYIKFKRIYDELVCYLWKKDRLGDKRLV